MAWNGEINRVEALFLLAGLVVFSYYSYTYAISSRNHSADDSLAVLESIDERIGVPSQHLLRDVLLVLFGLVALVVGAELLVSSSESIARKLGVSELVIGLTLVSIGTGLPELATTVVAVLRKETGIAFGNVVGSNLFNILFIGGTTALVRPLTVPQQMRYYDFPIMLGFTVLVLLLCLPTPHQLYRWKGSVLFLAYSSYVVTLFAINGG